MNLSTKFVWNVTFFLFSWWQCLQCLMGKGSGGFINVCDRGNESTNDRTYSFLSALRSAYNGSGFRQLRIVVWSEYLTLANMNIFFRYSTKTELEVHLSALKRQEFPFYTMKNINDANMYYSLKHTILKFVLVLMLVDFYCNFCFSFLTFIRVCSSSEQLLLHQFSMFLFGNTLT
jgi:hypothetical protein